MWRMLSPHGRESDRQGAPLVIAAAGRDVLPSLAENGMDTSVIASVNAINARIWSLMTGRPETERDTYPSWRHCSCSRQGTIRSRSHRECRERSQVSSRRSTSRSSSLTHLPAAAGAAREGSPRARAGGLRRAARRARRALRPIPQGPRPLPPSIRGDKKGTPLSFGGGRLVEVERSRRRTRS